jgi:Sulfotransferase family
MGAGRSGSTILGVALGNCTDVFYAGELDAWLRRSGVPNFGGSPRVRFWDGVREQIDGAQLFGDQAWRCLEQSPALFRVHRRLFARQLRRRYRRVAEDLYRTIAREAGATHVVDTSHYPLRAREMQRLDGVDLYILYLVRDPQSVVASFGCRDIDQPPKSAVAANAYLWLTHLLSVWVFLRQPHERRLFLRYEDFLADPEDMMRGILDVIDVSASPPEAAALSTGIPFQGNRLLRSQQIALRGSTAPRVRESRVTALLQRPWAAVFARLRPAVRSPSR